MPPLADLEDTQPVDDGGGGDDDDGGSHSSGETLEIETERLMDDSVLYGETQAVDDDGGGGGGNDDGIETQVVGDEEDEEGIRVLEDGVDSDASTDDEAEVTVMKDGIETQVVGDDDCEDDNEGIDVAEARVSKDVDFDASTDNDDVGSSKGIETQVVGGDDCEDDNEGIDVAEARVSKDVDFDASTDNDDVGNSKGIETKVVGDDDCEIDDEGIEVVEARVSKVGVHSDTSTDDDDARSSRGDFVSSELPPSGGSNKSNNGSVRSIASIRVASLRSSGLAAAKSFASKAINKELKSSCNSSENCNNQVKGAGEIDRDHETRNSQKNTQDYNRDESKSRSKNPVVKKLSYEQDSPCSHVPTNTGGLSYVGSQEPGDLSQANALDVVDKFLVVNYLGLSQEANTEKSTDMVKSPPISSAKGAQILVKKTDYRSPVGKKGIFEWIDSLEDDGGGEFFTKRRDSFFKRKDGAQKSRSHPPKSRHVSFGLGDKGDNITNHPKIINFTRSDSRLIRSSSLVTDKVHVAETRTKKNLFRDLNEQLNSKYLEPQLEVTDVDRDDGGPYEVGPDTQMAAEAMEALVHGSPINNEINDAHPAAGKGSRRRTRYSKPALSRNSTSSSPNLNDVSAGSKQRKMLPTKSKQRSPISSRGNSRGIKSLECTTEKTISERVGKKLETNINANYSVDHNKCSEFFKGGKTLTKEAGECSNSLTFNVQLSVSKELIQGEFHVNSTPVAHRTRRSKAVSLSKLADTGYEKDINATINVKTRGTSARDDTLVAGTGGSLKAKRICSDIASVQNAESERGVMNCAEPLDIEGLHIEDVKADYVKSSLAQPKRRRTRRTAPDNLNINEDFNNQSLSNDGIQSRNGKRKIRATVKSISEILDTAKRKRRSVSTHTASDIDGLNPDGGKAMPVSNKRTRSSVKSASLKPNVENALKNCFSRTDTHIAGSASLKQSGDCNCQVEVSEADKTEELPKQNLQPSGLPITTPSKDVDAVSPVVVAQYHPRTPGNNGRSRSLIARELIRLEASNSSPPPMFVTRRRKDMANICVLFSRHLADDIVKQQKKIMVRLGVPLASSILDATHFVTDNFVRTRNMLEAMALGKPVVTHMWLESCGQASCFIDEKNYILRDSKKEREIGFSMPVSLARACQNPLLQGKRVYITPNTKPSREVVSSLVKAAQGQPLERLGRSATKDNKILYELLVLSCEEDYAYCIPLLEKGAEVFSSELLLNGIVIQKLEFERHRLFLDHVKKTRSTLWLRREDGNGLLPVTKCT